MKYKVGDMANGQQTSKHIIEDLDYVSALEKVVEDANLYIEPADQEATNCIDQINEFVREKNRILGW